MNGFEDDMGKLVVLVLLYRFLLRVMPSAVGMSLLEMSLVLARSCFIRITHLTFDIDGESSTTELRVWLQLWCRWFDGHDKNNGTNAGFVHYQKMCFNKFYGTEVAVSAPPRENTST